MLTPSELVWLLAAVANGDQAAFERLYAATCAKLYGIVLRILRRADLADDVLREAYLTIWRTAAEFDPRHATPITWMVAIARRRALDVALKNGPGSIGEDAAVVDAPPEENPPDRHEMTDELRRVLACLGELEPDRRKLVLLAYYGGWNRDQLASTFEAPAATVKMWLRRSLMQIRECLEP